MVCEPNTTGYKFWNEVTVGVSFIRMRFVFD